MGRFLPIAAGPSRPGVCSRPPQWWCTSLLNSGGGRCTGCSGRCHHRCLADNIPDNGQTPASTSNGAAWCMAPIGWFERERPRVEPPGCTTPRMVGGMIFRAGAKSVTPVTSVTGVPSRRKPAWNKAVTPVTCVTSQNSKSPEQKQGCQRQQVPAKVQKLCTAGCIGDA